LCGWSARHGRIVACDFSSEVHLAYNWEDTAVRARREPLPRGQLVFLTAFPAAARAASADLRVEALRLQGEIRAALDAAQIPADVRLTTGAQEITAFVHTPDADAAFAVIQSILEASPLCEDGRVLLRYGKSGAPDRQIRLSPGAADGGEGPAPRA
jgi:hypothetical protein